MSERTAEIVIVNCGTKELAALALASALRNGGGLPVTVIDCESTDGSVGCFQRLQRELPFRLAHLPLRRHGVTLDRILRETPSDALLLLDSDAEILDSALVPHMLAALQPGVYGSGFLHAGALLAAPHAQAHEAGYYATRMWIPCVMLAVAAIREALASGQTFRQRVICNEVPQLPWLAKLLYLRSRIPGLRNIQLDALRALRRDYGGNRPPYIYCDTGADLHDFLLRQRGLAFADLGAAWWPTAVAHYHGVTRRALRPSMRNAADVGTSRREAVARLKRIYGVELP